MKGIKFWNPLEESPTRAVWVQLPLGWNTYLLLNSDIVNFVWKTDEGEGESIVLLIFVLWLCLNGRWWGVVGLSEISSFSSRGFGWSNKHDSLWHVVSTGCFCVSFFWAIAASNFRPLEIYKNLGLALSTITFTVNSHADNHSYKYIYLFQILYSIKSVFFLLKYTLRIWPRFLALKFELNVKHRSYFF